MDEKALEARIAELNEEIKSTREEQAQLMRNKDLYIRRLNAEILEVKNNLKRTEQKLKQQTDKTLTEFLKALAEVFTKVDAGFVDFKDDMSDSRQMGYTLSKFKSSVQSQNIEVMVPNLLEDYVIDEVEVTDVVPSGDKSLDRKVAHIDRVGFRNKITRAILIQPQVITYKYDEKLDNGSQDTNAQKERAMNAMRALSQVLGNRDGNSAGEVDAESALGQQMMQMFHESEPNQYNLPEVDAAQIAKREARKLSEKAHRAEEARQEALRKAEEARIEAEDMLAQAAIAEEKKLEAEKAAETAIMAEEARIAEEKRLEEERRKAEEARLEAERIERERIEAERRAEEARIAEEARLEAERLAEEARLEKERLDKERQEREAALAEKSRKIEEMREAARKRAEEARLAAERLAEEARLEEEKLLEEARLEEERLEKERLEKEALLAEKAKKAAEARRQAELLKNKTERKEEVVEEKVEEAAPVVEEVVQEQQPQTNIEDDIELEDESSGQIDKRELKRLAKEAKKAEDAKKADSVKSAWAEMARIREEKAKKERERELQRLKSVQGDSAADDFIPPVFDLGEDPLQDIPQEGGKKKRSNR